MLGNYINWIEVKKLSWKNNLQKSISPAPPWEGHDPDNVNEMGILNYNLEIIWNSDSWMVAIIELKASRFWQYVERLFVFLNVMSLDCQTGNWSAFDSSEFWRHSLRSIVIAECMLVFDNADCWLAIIIKMVSSSIRLIDSQNWPVQHEIVLSWTSCSKQ